MSERIGIVVSNDRDRSARVITDRKGGCGGCHSGHSGCRSCLVGAKLESRATNAVGARSGDLVKLTLPSSAVFQGTALLYVLPIVALIAGAFAGLWIAGRLGFADNAGSLLGALIGLGIAVWAVIRLGRSPMVVRRLTPAITAVVQRADAPPTASAGPAYPKPCCG